MTAGGAQRPGSRRPDAAAAGSTRAAHLADPEVAGSTGSTPPSDPEVVDLLPWLDRPEVRTLLAASMDRPSPGTLNRLTRWYRSAPAPVVVLGLWTDGTLLAVVGAVTRDARRCEVLNLAVAPTSRGQGYARRLVGLAASALQADEVIAHTDSQAVGFYRACGFTLTPVGEAAPGVLRYRAERAVAGLTDEAWFSAPRAHHLDDRRLLVELPPGGNTLPTVPAELAAGPLPSFVVEWLLETNEIGLILQTLLPGRFPPTTPPIRPGHVEEFLGPTRPLTTTAEPTAGAAERDQGDPPAAIVPGLPVGMELPVEVQHVAEMGQRLGAWLAKGARVRQWAESEGHGDAAWLRPLVWASDAPDSPDPAADTGDGDPS